MSTTKVQLLCINRNVLCTMLCTSIFLRTCFAEKQLVEPLTKAGSIRDRHNGADGIFSLFFEKWKNSIYTYQRFCISLHIHVCSLRSSASLWLCIILKNVQLFCLSVYLLLIELTYGKSCVKIKNISVWCFWQLRQLFPKVLSMLASFSVTF